MTIFGSTGTGKTKLSVDLALALSQHPYSGAEVISCDSMQIYQGLDIITNKATPEEMQGVPHHLLGFLDPATSEGEAYDVTRFVEDTNRIAERLVGEGKVPIVCGGTTYYLQHLLFPGRLITSGAPSEGGEKVDLESDPVYKQLSEEEKELLNQVSTSSSGKVDLATRAAADGELSMRLWKLLEKVDPVMASRWHYRDSRKVANSLRVYRETGQPHSQLIAQQDASHAGPASTDSGGEGVAGYRKLLFWLWCDPPILRARLDDRVDEMVSRGLIDEVKEMRRIAKNMLDESSASYQSGIFQTIGYRQFAEYLDKLEKLGEGSKKDWEQAVEDTKTSTRQYAKSQLKWVQNKLIPEVRRAQAQLQSGDVQLYLLDATDPSKWQTSVLDPALSTLHSFLNHQPLPDPSGISNPTAAQQYLLSGRTANQALTKLGGKDEDGEGEGVRTIEANKLFTCEVCTFDPTNPVLVREVDREVHRKGRHHRNNAKRRMSGEEKERRIAEKVREGERVRALRQQLKAATVADSGGEEKDV